MENSKHKAVWEWLQTCPFLTDLYFNLAQAGANTTTLVPSESINMAFVDGSCEKYYYCALTRWFLGSFEPNDTANIEKLIDFDRVSRWVEEQNEVRNYPAFPDGLAVQEVSVMPNQSGFIVEQNMEVAKFMLQFRIVYLERK